MKIDYILLDGFLVLIVHHLLHFLLHVEHLNAVHQFFGLVC